MATPRNRIPVHTLSGHWDAIEDVAASGTWIDRSGLGYNMTLDASASVTGGHGIVTTSTAFGAARTDSKPAIGTNPFTHFGLLNVPSNREATMLYFGNEVDLRMIFIYNDSARNKWIAAVYGSYTAHVYGTGTAISNGADHILALGRTSATLSRHLDGVSQTPQTFGSSAIDVGPNLFRLAYGLNTRWNHLAFYLSDLAPAVIAQLSARQLH